MWEIQCQQAGYEQRKPILKAFNLTLQQAERLVLLGKNGSGKSTFVQTLLGITPFFSLSVKYDNREIKSFSELRQYIGIVFQYPDDQFLGATVLEELYLNATNQQSSQQEIEALISQFQLQPLLQRSPFELSGGQKQILAFILTLLSNPKLLILDEATSMLDPTSKKLFLEQVLSYQQAKQVAIIHITHDLSELVYFETICYLQAGKIVFKGTYDQFMLNLRQIDDFVLPLDLRIAQKLYDEAKITHMPRTQADWEEVTWVLKSLI